MDILARYGPYFLYTYTVVLGLGVVLALGLTAVSARREPAAAWLDGAGVAAIGALLLGRVVFVWLNAEYFAENPAEAWQLQRGGLNYHGALLGGLAALWLWARLTGRPFYRYAGLFAPGLALLAAFGWAACGFEGCAYGRPASVGLLAADLRDNLGVFAVRYRTQLFGALGSLLVIPLTLAASRRARPSLVFWGTLAGLSLVRVVVALGRGDPVPVVLGYRLDFLIDSGLAAISLLAMAALAVTGRRPQNGR
ncbi:MAG: prolipoprotein diacylglyceryl transferase [Candidatus Promineofilum sp.]|nr:prolipoprotein diacylglyceryl transferase [Promineifilum sp.]